MPNTCTPQSLYDDLIIHNKWLGSKMQGNTNLISNRGLYEWGILQTRYGHGFMNKASIPTESVYRKVNNTGFLNPVSMKMRFHFRIGSACLCD